MKVMTLTEWTMFSLTAQMIEAVANLAFILGVKFRDRLVDVFYIFIELTVDQSIDTIVRQASASTLKRMAIYMDYRDVYDMLKDNLDYVVDNACVQLRNSVTLSSKYHHLRRIIIIDPLVVDAVFSSLGGSVFQTGAVVAQSKTQDSFSMLKDMILDTLITSINWPPRPTIAQPYALSLIRVMNVMVYRALQPKQFFGAANEDIQEGVVSQLVASTIA